MPAYVSEFSYYGDSSSEFIEVALPEGTDPSGYSLVIYDSSGNVASTFALSSPSGTMSGHDVYVVDDSSPGFATSDETGNFHPGDGLALVDSDGNVVQFLSYWGETVTANDGPAAGMTSTDVGSSNFGDSMQSDDGGNSYYAQSDTNAGTIPACYAPGTLIATSDGLKAVEDLQTGDVVHTSSGGLATIKWVWSGIQPLDDLDTHQLPVLIHKSALAPNIPNQDLVVSGQHRMAVGLNGQLDTHFKSPKWVYAKSLVTLPRIRFMRCKQSITWHHFMCEEHSIVFANGAASETMLLGPQVLKSLHHRQKRHLSNILNTSVETGAHFPMALPCLSVGETRRHLSTRKAREAA
jgi:hypothetical protein